MEWAPLASYGAVFVEITKIDHGHGGPGWEFGTCLWSPKRNRAGADRYSIMRKPTSGNLVLHFLAQPWPDSPYESRLIGRSQVATPVREVAEEPPNPGDWAGMSPYYRIDLRDYEDFPAAVPLTRTLLDEYGADIEDDLLAAQPRFYPFNRYGGSVRTVQGIYLAEATALLYSVFLRALGIEEASAGDPLEGHSEYTEARRLARERFYFARNPRLVAAAKEYYGYLCQVCGFDFEAAYGTLGHSYIECHHLSPLSERPELEQLEEAITSLDEVAVVCSNCHRMLHRRRPAMPLDELRAAISAAHGAV